LPYGNDAASRYVDIHANPKDSLTDGVIDDNSPDGNFNWESHIRAQVGAGTSTAGPGNFFYNGGSTPDGIEFPASPTSYFPPDDPNVWVRLSRAGDRITSYISNDGQDWDPIVTYTLNGLSDWLYVGPAYCPEISNVTMPTGEDDRLFLAQFRSVEISWDGATVPDQTATWILSALGLSGLVLARRWTQARV
jgi:hypothetical protein